MRIAIIGRTEILLETAEQLLEQGHTIPLIITSKAAPEYTKTEHDFELLADRIDATFVQTPRILDALNSIRKLPKLDIGISVNYTGVIPEQVIGCFRLGILNAHGGDLPRYRGNACQAWAILNGEPRIGLCIHKMIGGVLDSGDIIARDYFDINHNTKVTQIHEWMTWRTPGLFIDALHELEPNPGFVLEHQSKEPEDALRCYPRRPEDGCINWNQSALQVLQLINASNKPYCGAFCTFEGKRMIIRDAELVLDDEVFLAVPGQITQINSESVDVACGEGKLRINLVEVGDEVIHPAGMIRSIRKRLT